ncbi:hypothetical protein LOAG_19024 [Loa loa]|uniref:Uncharacterized protein n=1 Tax=Loa loa TaxID=7209 RepID=A0A1S0UD96_LOALO|nr:hypothetical protein LOAG_19024 [Loa loa]EJD73559.1 hypothetical protein LOAG_19024 [Loa loa]
MTYLKNVKEIQRHNKRYERDEETYELAINHLTDMLPEEFNKLRGFHSQKIKLSDFENVAYMKIDEPLPENVDWREKGAVSEVKEQLPEEFNKLRGFHSQKIKLSDFENVAYMKIDEPLPENVDWREKGAVSEVKEQGLCGSCWTFSAAGALEGQNFLKTGKLVNLSEQNILDCSDDSYGNYGCDGGLMMNAFKYVRENDGIDTEESYPYEGYQAQCRYSNESRGATAYDAKLLPWGDELQLQAAVASIGPISAAINSGLIRFYKKGIFSSLKMPKNC